MTTSVHKPQEFGQALKKFAEGDDTPYVRIATALRHMQAAEMHALAFGVIGSITVKHEYDQSQEFLSDQLDKGAKNMKAVLAGLNQVAANNRGAEQANLIDPKDIKLPEVKATDSNAENYVEGAALYSWKIGLLAMLTNGVTTVSAGLAWSAAVAVAQWLLYMPDDDAISKAHTHWTKAAEELQQFDTDLYTRRSALDDTWEGPAKESFSGYMDKFTAEVDEVQGAVKGGAETVSSLQTTLTTSQHFAFLSAIASLVALVALEIASWTPPTNRAGTKPVMEAIGAALGVSTSGLMVAIAGMLKTVGTGVLSLSQSSFVTEKESGADGNGVDFDEVALSKDDIDKLSS